MVLVPLFRFEVPKRACRNHCGNFKSAALEGVTMALMPVAEALAKVLAGVEPLPAEQAPLAEAHGRVLAADLAALRTQPPADVSAMDGYAVRGADVAGAPARLTVIGEVAAGRPFAGEVAPKQAARIFTGGVLPRGAVSGVIQELTERAGEVLVLDAGDERGQRRRGRGSDTQH